MRKSIKAVLLSALVFPGTGHLSLKKPVQGWGLIGITLVCLYFLISKVLRISKDLSAKIQSGEMPFDTAQINDVVTQQISDSDNQFLNISVMVIIVCWIVGVVDSFRIGRIQDKNA